MDRLRAEAIRVMYAQMRTTGYATLVVVVFSVAVALPFTPWPIALVWAAVPLMLLGSRELIFRAFSAAAPTDAEMGRWAASFVRQQALVGIAWAVTMILFAHPQHPLSVALTLCFLFSIGAGSVTSLSYYPRANMVLNIIIFGTVFVRLAVTGMLTYVLLGTACALYGLTMIGYCRNQSRAVLDALRVRFENEALVAALKEETARADEARGRADEARSRAEAASLAKSQFLAAASHDLRQPLYALSLFSAALDELELDASGRRVVAQISDSVAVMEQLFDGLLDISKLEAGVVRPRLAPVSVDALFDRLSQVFWPQADKRGLQLRLRSDGEWVLADVALLERALANLVANALGATERGGVMVAARRRGAALRFEVYDTGCGIAEADRTRVFEEFVQLDNPERDRRKGLGLGLGIARRSLDLIGATIDLRSHPGRGSRFSFVLRLAAPPADTSPPSTSTPAIARDGAVLIVDDDIDVRTAFHELLRRWRVEADLHAGPATALAAIDGGARYRLVLADYRLPAGMDGLTFIAAARSRHAAPVPPCVLVTGDFDPQLLTRAAEQGVPVLHKPLSRKTLRDWLLPAEVDAA